MNVNCSFHTALSNNISSENIEEVKAAITKQLESFLKEMDTEKYGRFFISMNLRTEPDEAW